MNFLELLQLKYFCDAAGSQNFSKTAKKFLVPPSNISQSIKRLEKEIGAQLFTRSANRIVLNEIGFKFYKKVKNALDLLDSAQQEARNNHTYETIRINIQINRRIVMETIENFQKRYPDVSFIITHTTDQNIYDYDITITDKDFDTFYTKQAIKDEKLLLAYNRDLFTFSKKMSIEELKDRPFITMSIGNSIYDCTHKICNDLGFIPHIVLESEDPFYIRKCIELGLGIAIVPEFSWRGQYADCVELKSIGDYKRTIYIYQKQIVGEHTKEFHDVLVSAFKNTK